MLTALLLSAANPVPKETDAAKLARLFGAPAEAAKGCKIALDGDDLRVTVPAGAHSFRHPGGAPGVRTSRKVTGDFTAQVAVRMKLPDEATGLLAREDALVAGGLIVRAGGERTMLHLFGWKADRPPRRGGRPGPFDPFFVWGPVGHDGQGGIKIAPAGASAGARVRLDRRGTVLTAYGDWGGGQKDLFWVCPNGAELPGLPAAVEVGVVVEHWLDKPVEVVFSGFEVTPADAPKK
jgi:hypothetical protein